MLLVKQESTKPAKDCNPQLYGRLVITS